MQPYFFPYIGYYQLVYEVEKFVFLDNVNFIKKGYINRNSILLNGQRFQFSLPVTSVSQNRPIHLHDYTGSFSNFIKVLEQGYKNSPYFSVAMPIIESVILDQDINVARKNAKSVAVVFEYLGVHRDFSYASQIPIAEDCKSQSRIIELCKAMYIDKYRNSIGGRELYERAAFAEKGIEIKFLQNNSKPYQQKETEFVSNLSVIDVLMYRDKESILSMLQEYILV